MERYIVVITVIRTSQNAIRRRAIITISRERQLTATLLTQPETRRVWTECAVTHLDSLYLSNFAVALVASLRTAPNHTRKS